MPEPAPAPPPLPPPVRTGARLEIEPDKQWKDDLRKRIEHELRNMVEEAQIMRDTTLNSQPPESSRERALQEYESSMTAIRKLAQEKFTRRLRLEMSERKWALNVIDSNSPDVARQQQWILDNVQKAQDERISSSPQQQRDGEGGSDESFEDGSEGFGDAGSDDEGRASDESRESEEDDDEDEGDEEDAGDSYGHPPRWDGSQPYVSGAAPRHPSPGSRAPSWRPHPRPPEPSGISRTLSYANGQTYSASPAPFPRRGSVNSTGSTGNGAGPHRAGSLNSGQYRSSSVAPHTPSSAERPPTQSRDRIGANISPRERQTPASASPRDRPSPPSYSIGSPRAIPGARPPSLNESMRFPISASPSSRAIYDPQRSPQDMRPGIAIPRGLTTSDEGPRGGSWDSSPLSPRFLNGFNAHRRHNSKGESRLPPVDDDYSDDSDDVVGRLDDRQSMHSARSLQSVPSIRGTYFEQLVLWREAEARRREEDATRKEAEANKKEEQARHRELEAQRKEEQARRKEQETQRKEEEARRREEEFRRKENDARKREIVVQQKAEEAGRIEEDYERKKREIERKKSELRKREAELIRKEEAARLAQEEAARQAEEKVRLATEEATRQDEETVNADETNRVAEEFTRQALETESTAAEQERQTKGQGRKGAKGQAKRLKAIEERRRKELEEQQRLEELRRLEEQQRLEEERKREEERLRREREEQIRIDEELSRQEQERLDREALLEEERRHLEAREKEANRFREERQRAVTVEERFDHSEEQRRKAAEQIRQRAEQHRQQQQQQEELRQRAKEEQEREFQRREALYYQRRGERECQNSMDASDSRTVHRPSPTAGTARSAPCISSSRSTPTANPQTTSSSFTSSSIRPPATPTPSSTGARPGAPRTSPRATRFDEAEWVQRAEERARQQQEQFRREQERLESERQAKSIKVQTQEELIRQLEPTGISGGNSRTATTLGGTASRGPFSSLEADEARRSEEGARRNEEEARREGEETRDKEEEARRKEVREARAEVQTFEERLRATEEELHNCLETLRQTLRQGFDVVHRTKAFIDRQEDALRRK